MIALQLLKPTGKVCSCSPHVPRDNRAEVVRLLLAPLHTPP